MQIRREPARTSTLEAFADTHGLIMVVTERQMDKWQQAHGLGRYVAYFDHVEVQETPGTLTSFSGSGNSEEAAIRDYANQISNTLLVVDAFKESRREIQAPRLTVPAEEPATWE